MKSFLIIILLNLTFLSQLSFIQAKTTSITIFGRVFDRVNKPIPNAKLTFSHQSFDSTYCIYSDSLGYYIAYLQLTTLYNNIHRHPKRIQLYQNYPNPFNSSTEIKFSLDKPTNLYLKIFNIRGQLIKTLIEGFYHSGKYIVKWDGTNNNGEYVSSGLYFYQLESTDYKLARKMMLIDANGKNNYTNNHLRIENNDRTSIKKVEKNQTNHVDLIVEKEPINNFV